MLTQNFLDRLYFAFGAPIQKCFSHLYLTTYMIWNLNNPQQENFVFPEICQFLTFCKKWPAISLLLASSIKKTFQIWVLGFISTTYVYVRIRKMKALHRPDLCFVGQPLLTYYHTMEQQYLVVRYNNTTRHCMLYWRHDY